MNDAKTSGFMRHVDMRILYTKEQLHSNSSNKTQTQKKRITWNAVLYAREMTVTMSVINPNSTSRGDTTSMADGLAWEWLRILSSRTQTKI